MLLALVFNQAMRLAMQDQDDYERAVETVYVGVAARWESRETASDAASTANFCGALRGEMRLPGNGLV